MQSEFIAVPPDWTVGQAIDYMRDTPDLPDRFYEIYAVDSEKHWQGAVSLDTLLRARRPVQIADLIDENRRRVSVLDDQEEVARMFGKYNLVAAPVVDTTNRLVGVITIDDVVDVIEEEADEDLKAMRGGREAPPPRTQPPARRRRARAVASGRHETAAASRTP